MSVRNGTAQYGLQDSVGSLLQQKGFNVTSMVQENTQDITETVIKYHAGHAAAARLLERKVPGSAVQEVPGTSNGLVLLLGSDYGTTTQTEGTGLATTPTPSPSFSSRTASQNICALADRGRPDPPVATVDHVRPILARVLAAASVLVALASAGAVGATVLGAGTAAAGPVGRQDGGRGPRPPRGAGRSARPALGRCVRSGHPGALAARPAGLGGFPVGHRDRPAELPCGRLADAQLRGPGRRPAHRGGILCRAPGGHRRPLPWAGRARGHVETFTRLTVQIGADAGHRLRQPGL